MHLHHFVSDLCDQDLHADDKHHDSNEHEVAKKAFKDVAFVTEFSSRKHVEDLH
jgi:hypothetical protein